jgi:serine/threonine-protein kinase
VQLAPKVAAAAATVRHDPAETRTVHLPLVRPQEFDSTRTLGLDDFGGTALVAAKSVLRKPSSPLLPALAAVAAVLAVVFLALAWPATPHRADPLDLTVGPVPAASPVPLDLTSDVTLAGHGEPRGTGPLDVRLSYHAAGVPLGETTARATVTGQGWRATVNQPEYPRWIAGGAVTGRVELTRDGASTSQDFTVQPNRAPLLSVMGAGSILLLLFTLAYLESVVRSLRRRQRRRTGPVLAALIGVPFGIASWLLGSVLLRQEPATGVGIACAGLGAVAGLAVAIAVRRTRPQAAVRA